jgi:hypothetical protein
MDELVESYAGYMSPERPRAFTWQGERIEIAEILVTGRLPGEHWFKVRSSGGEVFDLTYTTESDEWHIQIQSTD